MIRAKEVAVRSMLRLLCVSGVLLVAGCAGQVAGGEAALSTQDRHALSVLAEVAGPTSGVDSDAVTATECWLPSDSLIPGSDTGADVDTDAGTVWRVLCRVHYKEAG